MKLEKGMYVKTNDGIIDKVTIDYKGYCNSPTCNCKHVSCERNYYDRDKILKVSHNIIDLIEAGDIIEVNEFKGNYEVKQFGLELSIIKDEYIYNLNSLHCKLNIKSIVTKQQFESMKYEVKEDE